MNHNQSRPMSFNKAKAGFRQNSDSDASALERRGYTFGQKIGKGSYGKVVKATYIDERFIKPEELACKYVDKKKAPKEFLEKFLPREIEILSKIEHPNVIGIRSILQSGNTVFIFMEYATNGDLLEYIKINGAVPEPHAKLWFFQLTSALKYIHGLNYAHRDLKCENILISKHKNVKIGDFGFARKCVDEIDKKCLSKTFCGSAAYAAPEIVGGNPYDPTKSDVWSLGIILFIMLNGVMPFDDSSLSRLIKDQANRRYRFQSEVENELSNESKLVIHACLEPKPEKRFNIYEIYAMKWLKKHVDRISKQS